MSGWRRYGILFAAGAFALSSALLSAEAAEMISGDDMAIGGLRLGDTLDEAERRYGAPDRVDYEAAGDKAFITYSYGNMFIVKGEATTHRLVLVWSSDGAYRLPSRLGVGDTEKKLVEMYGEADVSKSIPASGRGNVIREYRSDDQSLYYDADDDGIVRMIWIEPRAEQ